jgi:Delta7-sterol 5-desaturase
MNPDFNPIDFLINKGAYVFAFDFGRYIIAAGLMWGLVWLMMQTRLARRKIQARTATREEVRREFLSSIQSCLVYVAATVFVVWGKNVGFLKTIDNSYGLALDLAVLAGIIIAHDAYFYWAHRAMHSKPLFKFFHRHHHRSITPTPFAAYSFALPEAVVMAMFVPIWQFFVATPGLILFTFLNFQIIRNVMGHAGFELMPRWWLSTPLTSWLNTTTHHDLHHAGSFKHNYGLYFTWWDKMMGTEHPKYHETFARVTAPDRAPLSSHAIPSATL